MATKEPTRLAEEVSSTTDEPTETAEQVSLATEEPTDTDSEPAQTSPTHYIPKYVHFQQTLIREKVKVMSDDEATAVTKHIDKQYAAALKAWERPWLATPKTLNLPKELCTSSNSGLSEEELEMCYYQK